MILGNKNKCSEALQRALTSGTEEEQKDRKSVV